MNFEQLDVIGTFERNFAKYIGAKHCIAVMNGTAALHTALLSCGVTKEHNVITCPYTFIATSNSILYCGAEPRFADIYGTANPLMDIEKAFRQISFNTKAIMPVSIFGKNAGLNIDDSHYRILANLEKIGQKVYLINDASRCIQPGVNDGFDLTTFSFYRSKNFSCFEGGAIVTDDDELAKKCRQIIDHGTEGKYNHVMLGYNYRMSDLQALMINHLVTYHNIGGKAELGRFGPKDGHYPRVVYDQPYYHQIGLYEKWKGTCPNAEELARKVREKEIS